MKYCLFIFSLLLPLAAFTQTLKGRVTDELHQPVPAASVYIKETKQGLIANHSGEFQTPLTAGAYHLEVRCIGYETETLEVHLDGNEREWTVVLKEKDFQLQEVEVRPGEDPAYEMMRQAIKKAPYYQSVIKEATYETYSKGSGKITQIPKLLEKMSESGEKMNIIVYKDKLFMQESVTEIKFTAPNRYEKKVMAYSSTFPKRSTPESALSIDLVSLYSPMYAGVVSPLNPKAFDYYRFRYEGYDEENDQIINKIRIIPKLNDPQLMEGIIYLTDDEWSIRHADFNTRSIGFTAHYTLNYHPVVDNIYLVANHELNVATNLLGMKMNADFLFSIRYKDILLNDSLPDMPRKKAPPAKKKSLEIKREDRIQKTVDSLAVSRDSLYWSEVRTVVLNAEELKSYELKDSIQAYTDSIGKAEDNPKFEIWDLVLGDKLGNDSSLLYFHYSGLRGVVKEYNFVDGFQLGQSVELDFKKKNNTGWKIFPSFYWATARKTFLWQTDVSLDYSPRRLGHIQWSAGHVSEDLSGSVGMSRLANSLYTFLWGYNQIKLYDLTFGKVHNQIDLANGLQGGLGLEWANRRPLNSHTNWRLFGKETEWESNLPDYDRPLHMQFGRLAQYALHFNYTPEYYYRMDKGKKYYVRSRFPTFGLDYRQGLNLSNDYSAFQSVELSVRQTVKSGVFSRLNYTVMAGTFLNSNDFNYIDYKHFNVSGAWLTFKDWKEVYVLLPYYSHSTSEEWMQVFVNYNTDYLLLKRLPFLQGKLFTETLQAKFLHTPGKKFYSEWGYSVELPMGVGGAGLFVSLDDISFNSFGVLLSMPLFGNILNKKSNETTVTIGY